MICDGQDLGKARLAMRFPVQHPLEPASPLCDKTQLPGLKQCSLDGEDVGSGYQDTVLPLFEHMHPGGSKPAFRVYNGPLVNVSAHSHANKML